MVHWTWPGHPMFHGRRLIGLAQPGGNGVANRHEGNNLEKSGDDVLITSSPGQRGSVGGSSDMAEASNIPRAQTDWIRATGAAME
jgi:hypothetical protein